jgi:hypothetical protein
LRRVYNRNNPQQNNPQISQISQIQKAKTISHEKAQKAQKRKRQSCIQHAHIPDGSSCVFLFVPFVPFCGSF